MEKCRKKQLRKKKDSDIGENGITLAARRRKVPDEKAGTENNNEIKG